MYYVHSQYMWGVLKWWYPTTMGFPTKNDHFGVVWGYHHLSKHPHVFVYFWMGYVRYCWLAGLSSKTDVGSYSVGRFMIAGTSAKVKQMPPTKLTWENHHSNRGYIFKCFFPIVMLVFGGVKPKLLAPEFVASHPLEYTKIARLNIPLFQSGIGEQWCMSHCYLRYQ